MKKSINIFNLVTVLIIFTILSACMGHNSIGVGVHSKKDTIFICSTIKLPISNTDSSHIGFLKADSDIDISITTICLDENFLYLADELHKNIKKLNLDTKQLTWSNKLTKDNKYKQFSDIGVFKENVYVTSTGNNVFKLNKELVKFSSFKLPTLSRDPVFIFSSSKEHIEFFMEYADTLFTIDNTNKFILSRKLTEKEITRWRNKFDLSVGQVKYKTLNYYKKNNNEYIAIGSKIIKLETPFKYCGDIVNLDFNDKYLVIFNIDPLYFTLYVYKLD